MTGALRAVQVAVAGPSDATEDLLALAAEVGAGLAGAGCVVVVGSGDGVSRAAASAAAERGGLVVHLMPQAGRAGAVPGASVVVPTGLGETCNALVVCASDVVVAVGGGWGTLSEVALAVRTGVPVVVLRGWRVVDGHGRQVGGPVVVTDPGHAVATALALAHRPAL